MAAFRPAVHGSAERCHLVATPEPGAVVAGFLAPHAQAALVRALKERRITSFAMELVPRISRAQSMDALSSQAAVAGYKAVLIAAAALDKFYPMLTTAAGTIRPATVLVIGAGVAGLQAIATARRLGAVVEAYDVRSATREQIKSLGAKFVETGVVAEGTGGYARELTARKRQAAGSADSVARQATASSRPRSAGRPAQRIMLARGRSSHETGSLSWICSTRRRHCELTRPQTVDHTACASSPVNLRPRSHIIEAKWMRGISCTHQAAFKRCARERLDDEGFAASCVRRRGPSPRTHPKL